MRWLNDCWPRTLLAWPGSGKVPDKQEAYRSWRGKPWNKSWTRTLRVPLAAKAIADGLNKTKTVALLKEAVCPRRKRRQLTPEALVASVEATKAPADEAPVDEAPVDEAPVDEAPVDEAPVDEAPVDEAPVEEL